MQHTKTAVVLALLVAVGLMRTANAQEFSAWGLPIHLDWGVNTDREEMNPVLSKDGLSLFFQHREESGPGIPFRHYVAHRASVDAPWGAPIDLGEVGAMLGGALFISNDGHRAYFSLTVGIGDEDLYVSRRRDKNDDFGWGPAESLGSAVNTEASETQPALYEDEARGVTFLYFTSNRAGTEDIYASVLREDGTFAEAVAVAELNSDRVDRAVKIRRDGLECVLTSNRDGSFKTPGGSNSMDLWYATRASTSDAWSTPVNMDEPINSGRTEGFPTYSFDGSQLYFQAANREGNFGPFFDIWMVQREKVTGQFLK